MTYTDASYEGAFANWMHCVTRVARAVPAVIALDMRTAEYFAIAGAPVIFVYDSRQDTVQESSRSATNQENGGVLFIKGAFTKRLLDEGLRVIFSELDVFWLADPLLIEDRSVDIQVVQQGYNDDVINSGFWIAQPSVGARGLFGRIEDWVRSPYYFPCNDQHLYNMALRGTAPNKRTVVNNCSPRNHSVLQAALLTLTGRGGAQSVAPLRWKHIPLQLIPHPFKFYKSGPQQPPWDVISFGGAIAVHLWRTIAGNPPALRIKCAKAYGFWALPQNDVPRVAPYFSKSDDAFQAIGQKFSVSHRLALVQLFERISEAQGDSPERRAERIFFRPAFNLSGLNHTLRNSAAHDYNGPAAKCGMAMVTYPNRM
jgi:hypothetical protein